MKSILILLLFPLPLLAQKNYPELLDQYLQAQSSVKGFSGSVLVAKQNSILLQKAYGMADREWKISNTTDGKFRIGSMTKQFTATCILQLAEQGKLNLDDKLSKYIPDFPKGDSVTIHMLLNHTSGIASYTDIPEFKQVATLSWSLDSMISFFKNKPYNFSPGSKYKYSNSGYFLLGYIVEKASGQKFNTYLRQHILDKLDLENTGMDKLDSILPLRVKGYTKNGNRFENAPFISMEWPFSAGVMYSTVSDLYQWERALLNSDLLSASSRNKMFTPGKGNYGYGLVIDSLANHPRMGHGGSIPGFRSNIVHYTEGDICIIVLSNDEFSVDLLSDGLAGILYNMEVEIPYIHKEVKINPALLERYVGKYNAFLTIEVIQKNGKLYRHREGTPDIELKPESETKFFYADGTDRQLEFEFDGTGHMTKIWFINNGQRGEMKKIQ